jgi:hypothetical protein
MLVNRFCFFLSLVKWLVLWFKRKKNNVIRSMNNFKKKVWTKYITKHETKKKHENFKTGFDAKSCEAQLALSTFSCFICTVKNKTVSEWRNLIKNIFFFSFLEVCKHSSKMDESPKIKVQGSLIESWRKKLLVIWQ